MKKISLLASLRLIILVTSLASSAIVMAQNRVVVIPMSGDDLEPLANIITVAKNNGDFTNPIDAMNSISDASETNPYLIVIAPGVYDIGTDDLDIKSFVSVAGSGPKITVITGTGSQLVATNDDTFIQDVSLVLTGTTTGPQTVINGSDSDRAIVQNVHASLDNDNSSNRRVLLVRLSDDTIIRDSILEVTGSVTGAVGITSSGAGPDILVSNTIISLPNSTDDPITFEAGGTVEAICDSVSFVSGSRSFGDRVILEDDCTN